MSKQIMLDCVMATEYCLTTMLDILYKYQKIEQIYKTWCIDLDLERDFKAMLQIRNIIEGDKKNEA